MFRGQYSYFLDDMGRIAIPAKLRKEFKPEAQKTIIVVKGFSKCIDLYPLDEWKKIEEKLLQLNTFNELHTKFIRMVSSNVTERKMDNQARIVLPKNLLEYAQIEKEVMIIGALKKIEVWNPKVFDDYLKNTPETYEEIAAKVMVF
ncbi:MAG: division/cell wall cluster transcriptional repressor MraZ [Ignavibacterium sp.]|nr:division/cell wall cluster transcriptional repressor MraZ [Ignavibacterium sp.]MDW8375399.1 division/cell wall cluster transcriptional repressor MraZ [Ignavibacteriales bacterium]